MIWDVSSPQTAHLKMYRGMVFSSMWILPEVVAAAVGAVTPDVLRVVDHLRVIVLTPRGADVWVLGLRGVVEAAGGLEDQG
jgi:hypothetical protein